jgi:23S rRNA pseudouridine1911/1915/1917 synthase
MAKLSANPLKFHPEILFEDDWALCMNKPAGLLIQGDKTGDPDLLSIAREHIAKGARGEIPFIGLVHRLDRPASGIVLFAKTPQAAAELSRQFRTHSIKKTYWAVVHGETPNEASFTDNLIKEPQIGTSRIAEEDEPESKFSELRIKTLGFRNERSLVEIKLVTGRSHQIRVQLSSRGFPIVGDRKYGSREVLRNPGMIALWAKEIAFMHPVSRKIRRIISPKPAHWPWFEEKPERGKNLAKRSARAVRSKSNSKTNSRQTGPRRS